MTVALEATLDATGAPDSGAEVDRSYLLSLHELQRRRIRAAVEQRRRHDPDPDDRFRGLYVSDDQALSLLAPRDALVDSTLFDDPDRLELDVWADDHEASRGPLRLRRVARSCRLSPLDVELLLVALGPDLDPRLEQAYGYLHDDVTRRRASIGLALELCAQSPRDHQARSRFGPRGPLIALGLIEIDDQDRPYLTRSLRVPDPVASYLLGDEGFDPDVAPFVVPTGTIDTDVSAFSRALDGDVRLMFVRDRVGAAALSFVASGVERTGRRCLSLDVSRLAADDDPSRLAVAATRLALLTDSVLIVNPVDALAERGGSAVRAFAESAATAVLIGSKSWDPSWSRTAPLMLDAPDINALDRDLPFRLTPEQATNAREAARLHALAAGVETPRPEDLAAGARAQNAAGLERLALRVNARATMDDLVVPSDVGAQLREVVDRVRFRDQVLGDWGVKRSAAKGRGVTALFAGDSGTGKTLAAEVLAGALGLDLYVIDLATVVDKYIGETEKNLDRIFGEADRVNGVLLFDEADAIFGKRSEVSDAHDRYANVEVAYLLQRMERFDGIAILTTNLRANIDEAFLRRLDALIDFPTPDADLRRTLWERHLPPSIPRCEDVDLEFLSTSFDLAGGNIANVARSAAYLGASGPGMVDMAALIRATAQEYRKLGRLCVASEFGPYYELASW